ncbi:MAG: hypothetical protein JWM93_2233 [Frankiales bacterium]|nr:hypothetical protein [Frankiales bacterium]
MADAAALAAWVPQQLAAVTLRLDDGTDDVLAARSSLARDVGGPLFAAADAWRGAAARACEGRLLAVTDQLATVAAGLGDLAGRTDAAVALAAPVEVLRTDLAAAAALDRAVPADPLGVGAILVRLATRRRVDDDVSAVIAADRRAAGGFDDSCAAAHALLRRWNTAALRDLLASEGVPPGIPAPGSEPALVADWWASRTAAERAQWLATSPAVLGSLDGLPASARDTANRLSLQGFLTAYDALRRSAVDELWRAVAAGDLGGVLSCRDRIDALDRRHAFFVSVAGTLADYAEAAGGDVPVQLLLADAEAFGDHGSAAVAFGDVDTAAHVAFVVPGFRQRVVPELRRAASNAWAVRQSAASTAPAAVDVATVAWVGYDVPMGLDVAFAADATAGAGRLRGALRGLRASRPGRPPHLTVIGHSYGSTAAGVMLRDWPDAGVDDFVAIGSPGVGVASARELHVPPGHVWVGAASGDPVDGLARFGADPATEGFGASRFDAETTHHAGWNPFEEHSHYLDAGGPSLANIAAVVSGRPGDVVPAPRRFELPALPSPQWVDPARRAS